MPTHGDPTLSRLLLKRIKNVKQLREELIPNRFHSHIDL